MSTRRPKVVVGVGIGPAALADGQSDPAVRRAFHEELLEDLSVHGRLVFNSERDRDLFIEGIKALPTSLAKAWESVLAAGRVTMSIADPPMEQSLSEMLEVDTIDAELADDLDLVLLDRDQAELLGVPEDEFSRTTPSGMVEIGRISTAGRTVTLLSAQKMLDSPLREGSSREMEWETRFEPLVSTTSQVTVYDRFVGQQTARRYIYNMGGGDGLTWFLTRMAMKPGRRVRIITAVSDELEGGRRYDEDVIAGAFTLLQRSLAERGLHIDLVLVPDKFREPGKKLERFGHDRHLRFGDRAALALGSGMQCFAKGTFTETVTVARLPIPDARAREERAIKAAVRPPLEGWVPRL